MDIVRQVAVYGAEKGRQVFTSPTVFFFSPLFFSDGIWAGGKSLWPYGIETLPGAGDSECDQQKGYLRVPSNRCRKNHLFSDSSCVFVTPRKTESCRDHLPALVIDPATDNSVNCPEFQGLLHHCRNKKEILPTLQNGGYNFIYLTPEQADSSDVIKALHGIKESVCPLCH